MTEEQIANILCHWIMFKDWQPILNPDGNTEDWSTTAYYDILDIKVAIEKFDLYATEQFKTLASLTNPESKEAYVLALSIAKTVKGLIDNEIK